MYSSGVHVEVNGEGKDGVSTKVDESSSTVVVTVEDSAKDKDFEIVITPQ